MCVLSVLKAPNTKTNSLCVQTHLTINSFWFWIWKQYNSLRTLWNIFYYKLKDFQVTRSKLMDWSRVDFTCLLLLCFYQLSRLSLWRHPFTTEDPLVNKWCNAKFHPNIFLWRNKLKYTLAGLRVSTFFFTRLLFWGELQYSFKTQCAMTKFELH